MGNLFGGRGESVRRQFEMRRAVVMETLESRRLLAANLVISEFLASNDNNLADSYGDHEDWVEIHNAGDAPADLHDYFLTDDAGNPEKWRFPSQALAAGEYVTVFASNKNLITPGGEMHTNFQLSAGGEYLGLINASDDTVQFDYAPAFPVQSTDISYGLEDADDPGSARIFFSVPTPGAVNVPSVATPTFSVPGKTFTTSFQVAITTSTPGAAIRYTTDGSVPTAGSTLYTGSITISTITRLRAKAFLAGYSDSPINSVNYIAVDSTVSGFNSNLPIVILDSYGASMNDATWRNSTAEFINTNATTGRANMLDDAQFVGRIGLRYRGSTSYFNYPKKQFAVEVRDESDDDKNASILGMPSESDWVLYAPWTERSLMNNELAMQWFNEMGHYASRTRFVEVYFNANSSTTLNYNDDYLGVYILMEKPKVDSNRVDIDKLRPTDTTEPDITGGYMFKKDRKESQELAIDTPGGAYVPSQKFVMVDPDETEMTASQLAYLTNYMNELDGVMNGPNFADPVNGYSKYIDVDSWIDFWIEAEFTRNVDSFWLSTFFYKPRNGTIHMGPVWDFNLAFGQTAYHDGASAEGWNHDWLGTLSGFGYQYGYFQRLFQDPAFQVKVADRWQELRKTVLSTSKINADIDANVALLTDNNGNYPVGTDPAQSPANAAARNFERWPVLGVAGNASLYYDAQGRWIEDVNMIKNWLRARAEWMDTQFPPAPVLSPAGGNYSTTTPITITGKQPYTYVDTPILQSGAAARAVIPTSSISNWNAMNFTVPAGWLSGTTPVGYDNTPTPVNLGPFGLDTSAMKNSSNTKKSVYVRVNFNIANPANIDHLIFRMKYDDGLVAWVNGVRVTEAGVADNLNPTFSSASNSERTEANAQNWVEWDISEVKNQLVAGTNVIAIQGMHYDSNSNDFIIVPELYSRTYSSANGGAVYYTTDGSDPRNADGTVNPAALLYTGSFNLSETTRVRARRYDGATWSGIADEAYDFDVNSLRVTELMYNPPAPPAGSPYTAQDFEYIEIKNVSAGPLNLNGLKISAGVTFNFPDETLAPGEYALAVKNIPAFESRYGTSRHVLGLYSGSLDNGGEGIAISNSLNTVLHAFTYDDAWYPTTDGGGYSLVIADPNQALSAWDTAAGWRASYGLRGTPGASDGADSTAPTNSDVDYNTPANQIVLHFSEPISIASPSSLVVTDLVTSANVTPISFTASGNVATIVLPGLASGLYQMTLPAGGVMDMSTNLLAAPSVFTFAYVAAAATLSLPQHTPAYVINRLSIGSGGTLDIGANSIVLRGDSFATVSALVASGFGNSDWLGSGITSSAAANDPNFHLAVADNATLASPFGTAQGGPLFDGVDVPLNCVLVKFTHRVDLNLDGLVSDADAIVFSTNYEAGASASWAIGDLNMDGVFSDDDAILFSTFYDTGLPPA